MNFYIADTHFGHANIMKYSKRPFKTIDDMDKTIIENWNKKVGKNDHVYILGDFSFKSNHPSYYLNQLNGIKHLIPGNHDKEILKCKGIEIMKSIEEVNDNGRKVVLCHYPLVDWNGYYYGVHHFYGHVHNTFHNPTTVYASQMKNAHNVGVDIIGFEPCTYDEIVKE